MNVYGDGNVLDVCTFRPRSVLRRRSSRLEVQDECHADPYRPDFIASWHSQLGWLANAFDANRAECRRHIRLVAEMAPRAAAGRRDLAQSQAAEHRPDRRL